MAGIKTYAPSQPGCVCGDGLAVAWTSAVLVSLKDQGETEFMRRGNIHSLDPSMSDVKTNVSVFYFKFLLEFLLECFLHERTLVSEGVRPRRADNTLYSRSNLWTFSRCWAGFLRREILGHVPGWLEIHCCRSWA